MALVSQYAVENGVRLMVDAEQTYFQPAITRLTLEMQRIFKRNKPIIFNTFQCYLKVCPTHTHTHTTLITVRVGPVCVRQLNTQSEHRISL